MINILSYVGMNMQSEVCLWTLLGLMRTIFDATLFKVNANLKQVWQMTMPEELSMPVQRVLRTMISGVMLVQCFTVYVYLASYIVLLYPVFLEERPTLVLPWLLLAAVRKLLCELTSLALGLGTCVLLGPARPPCIKFVVVKFASIMPAFYMWMLVFSYYHMLKVAAAFKTFPAVLPPNDHDYGLELAVRRRRTKSLLGEDQLRKKLVANFYGESSGSITNQAYLRSALELSTRMVRSPDTSIEEVMPVADSKPLTVSTTGWSDIGSYEDWFGSEVMIPRDTDRILEQIVLMLLRIGAYLKKEGLESIIDNQILNSAVPLSWLQRENIDCSAMNADETETPPLVGSIRGNMASYLREYPQIFMKKAGTDVPPTEPKLASLKTVHSHVESEDGNTSKSRKRVSPETSTETISTNVENIASKKKISISDIHKPSEVENDKLLLLKQQRTMKASKNNEGKKKQLTIDSESQFKVKNEIPNGVQNELEVYKISSNDKTFTEHTEAFSSRTSVQKTSNEIREQQIDQIPKTPIKDNIETTNIIQKNEKAFKKSIESLNPTTTRSLEQHGTTGQNRSERKDLEFRFKANGIINKEKYGSISSDENESKKSTNTTSSHALVQLEPIEHTNELEKKVNHDSESQSKYDIEIKYQVKNGFKSHQIILNENKYNERTQATSSHGLDQNTQIILNENKYNERTQATSSHGLDQNTSTQLVSKQETKDSESQSNNDKEVTDTTKIDLDENNIALKENTNDESTNDPSSREQHTSAQNSDEVENNNTKPSPDKDLFNKPKTK